MQKDDVIYRQQAIDALLAHATPRNNGDGTMTVFVLSNWTIQDILSKLPSAQLDRKKGHWETGYTYPDGAYWKCSCCGELSKVVAMQMDYCGRCGAYMLGEKDG